MSLNACLTTYRVELYRDNDNTYMKYTYIYTVHVNERCIRKEKRSKQSACLTTYRVELYRDNDNRYMKYTYTCTCIYMYTVHVNERCIRKEERSKQSHSNNKAKQHNTTKVVTFLTKNELPRVGCTCIHVCVQQNSGAEEC